MSKDSHTLKNLMVILESHKQQLGVLESKKIKIESDIERKKELIIKTEKNIEKLKKKGPIVTEHALLRFFERVLGYDLEEVKKLILTPEVKELVVEYGSGCYPTQVGEMNFTLNPTNTFSVRVVDNSVVTLEERG